MSWLFIYLFTYYSINVNIINNNIECNVEAVGFARSFRRAPRQFSKAVKRLTGMRTGAQSSGWKKRRSGTRRIFTFYSFNYNGTVCSKVLLRCLKRIKNISLLPYSVCMHEIHLTRLNTNIRCIVVQIDNKIDSEIEDFTIID